MSNAPVKKVELTRQQQFENLLFGMAAPVYMVQAIRWYASLCWHTRRKHHRYAGPPVCIELFGSDPLQGREILADYGIRSAYGSLQWAVIENKVALRFMFLVSQASFDYADNILSQYAGQAFDILTSPGTKRGQALRQPYAARQHTAPVKQPTHKTTRLGKPYQTRQRGE